MGNKNSAATAYVRELCSLGLAGELLIPALLEALHRVIPSARNLFDWVNAEGCIRRYYFEGPIDHHAARLYFDEFHNRREAEAMPKYADVIRGEATIRSAEELNNRQFFDSALYHEIWRPQHLHYRLEAIVRGHDRKPLGSLVLYREQGDRIFNKAEEESLLTLVPYVAHGLQHGQDRRIDFARSDRRAVLVNLDALGRIVHLGRNAHKVLLLAHGDISPASAAQEPLSENFPTLTLLHRQLSRAGDVPEAPCALTLTNTWGQFEFRAERMEAVGATDAALIGVTIQHLVPREVRDLDLIEATALSIAQKRVCALLLQGLSQAQIAARLGVSGHTVIDHIRKVYLKLDVHSVEELRSRFGERSGA
jgi:DNA-binding CsgD family transcriptional regulator